MTMPFKQFESYYYKNELCKKGYSWIKFSHCLNFGCDKYGNIIFSIQTQNGCTHCMLEVKNLWSE